ncbi:hypothetical protein DPMN_030274 [Dreissena polymorpha]|uniref:Uncharacterized protein n=1 Tax=Dreissena polymorpha TaxID=45954 RepID=A0A9D4RG81_DREPO|nr:hypothetical protein DPMN_030274 [Dreissena polymorpha]
MTKRRNAKSRNRNNHSSSTSMVPFSPANQDLTVTDFSSGSWPVTTRVQEECIIPVHFVNFHRILPDGRINRRPSFTLIVPFDPTQETANHIQDTANHIKETANHIQETANSIQETAPIAGYRANLHAKARHLKTAIILIVLFCVVVFEAYLCGCFD